MTQALSLVVLCALVVVSACSDKKADETPSAEGQVRRIGDAETGRRLFADKGCVICHSVNGVGGKAAPPLDAQTETPIPDPVDFAARMWRGAPAMVELQSLELGYVISLDAQEIIDLSAFAESALEQRKLKLSDIDEGLANSFLDEQFWETEDWTEFLKDGQDGFGVPPTENDGE